MRVEYINPFVEATFKILEQVLGEVPVREKLYLKNTSQPVYGVAVIVGLAGDVEGRVLFDMSAETALSIASSMNGEQLTVMDELVKETIMELANMITASAITKLQDLGYSFDLTPPAIFTGDNMQILNSGVEALIVPVRLQQGKLEINVAIRERL